MENSITSTSRPRTGAGSLGWVWQAVTGVALVFLAGLHMIAHHFVVEGGLRNFQQAQEYLAAVWPLEVLFLIVVTAHALLGVRAVLFDLGLSPTTEKRITQALWGVGVITLLYGFWLTWMILTYPA